MLNRLGALWRLGWSPIASYFILLLVFFALALLTSANRLNLWSAVLVAFLFSTVLALIMYARLISPLEEMASIAQDMARGNLEQEIRIFAQDEIGDLARSINYMARQLKTNIDDIIAEKNRIQAILASMADGVIAMDPWGRVILVNPVVEKLFGITQEASRGKNILRIIRNNELEKMINHALETGQPIDKLVEIQTPDPFIFYVNVTPLKNGGAEQGGLVAVLKDITERKRVEEMRSDFVANVSHELRTPLTSIRGFAETLLDGAVEDPKVARPFLEIINTETERLSRLIDELLNLSKIEDKKTIPNWQTLNISNLIDRAVTILKPRAIEKEITIDVEASETIPVFEGDADMMCQVLINLIDNSISYTQSGGEIHIRASAGAHELKVDVQDNGIGIPQESLHRVFERFYRVDKARSREHGGTGLGLSIVKHIIDAHHGTVQVESNLGVGSTFSFVLPLAIPNHSE
ncbi:Alkaline phosphatase synthesis sensor protein PhoR [Pelotomaculum schinkii]|uniref:histidine kinase n=1 Tax=Pelotomaculum schinkii TaxID=78350 RepID=A0A4Y7RAI6_9FIRM|nr:ATP-binding protein [Pelotomaculum schinkii]TEB05806.1 Alkaline phosphatase synthesis sensor protein PhoR [Pelotomaculum schinkii]